MQTVCDSKGNEPKILTSYQTGTNLGKVQCPTCQATYRIDHSKISDKRTHMKCPKCKTSFFYKGDFLEQKEPEKIICPKCGHKQNCSDECEIRRVSETLSQLRN